MRIVMTILIVAAFAAGCAVGPNYQKPKVAVEKNFDAFAAKVNTNPPPADWWKTFNDLELEKLISDAARQNYDLQIATLRVREARYQRNIMAGNLLPTVDADGGYLRAVGSKNVTLSLGGSAPPDPAGLDANDDAYENELSVLGKGGLPGVWSDLYQMGFDATWEIDIFGGIRRRVQAANEQTQAAVESQRNLMITLFAEVARDYLELRSTQERLDIAQKNLADQTTVLQVTRSMRTNGLASDLEVTQAAAEVAATKATIPPLQSISRRLVHVLSILLAREPSTLASELAAVKPLPVTPPDIPVGMPSQLLERRPDIRAAERQIAVATADIGVAEADLFPKFALTGGSAGIDSSQPGTLFNWNSHYFLVSPTVTWRIFDAGRIANNIKLQKAGREEAFLQYRSTILAALQEVEDSLVAVATDQSRRTDLIEALNQNRQSLALSRQQYEHGLSNFLNVLDAERGVYIAEDNLAQADENISLDSVALYKSLGGGW
jgi:NodT family efflux transporter outer membrane factor (OMF) lipoprotein